jgi:hypothetical protein
VEFQLPWPVLNAEASILIEQLNDGEFNQKGGTAPGFDDPTSAASHLNSKLSIDIRQCDESSGIGCEVRLIPEDNSARLGEFLQSPKGGTQRRILSTTSRLQ